MFTRWNFSAKGEECASEKYGKERITIILRANMSEIEELKLFIIGKVMKPEYFKEIKSLLVDYR